MHEIRRSFLTAVFQFLVELIMPQIMIEAFARSLIDKIMLEAFDTVDTNDEKLQTLHTQLESTGIQAQSSRTALQIQDLSCTDNNEPETRELIEKMVHGLRNLQIGDSTSVPHHLSKLEKQVKHVVCSIDNVSPADVPKVTETHITHGQGDVHQIIHDAVIEATPMHTHLEKETDGASEATRVSVSLLHRMIEELEEKPEKSQRNDENKSEAISKDKIAAWEETEEQFVRTIESVDEPDQSNIPPQSDNTFQKNACDFTDDEITSSPVVHSTPFTRTTCLDELTMEEITPSPLPDQSHDGTLNVEASKMKMKSFNAARTEQQKKKGPLGRTWKLFRTIFGRRKK